MLWQRVITALLLIPLVVVGILWLDNPWFAFVVAVLILIGAFEMAKLANLRTLVSRLVYVALVAAVLWLAWRFLLSGFVMPLQWVMSAWWLMITAALLLRRSELLRVDAMRPAILLLGLLVLVSAWSSIVGLHGGGEQGPALVLFLFVLIWVADSGAYFAGRAFGQRKLSPFVSPGKTWAGAAGAAVGAVVAALVLVVSGGVEGLSVMTWVALCVVVTVISIGGDLWESQLKREAGVKDSGTLLPGHGGMLDRIDSLLAAAPMFALGAALLGLVA